jgi:hypothetical protein
MFKRLIVFLFLDTEVISLKIRLAGASNALKLFEKQVISVDNVPPTESLLRHPSRLPLMMTHSRRITPYL